MNLYSILKELILRSPDVFFFVQAAAGDQRTEGRVGGVGEFPGSALIRADQFHAHEGNVRTFVVVKIIHGLDFRSGGEFVEIDFVLMLPMDAIHEQFLHGREWF